MDVPTFYPLGKDKDGNLVVGSTRTDRNFPRFFIHQGHTFTIYKPFPSVDDEINTFGNCMVYELYELSGLVLEKVEHKAKQNQPTLSVHDLLDDMNQAFLKRQGKSGVTAMDIRLSQQEAIREYCKRNGIPFQVKSLRNNDDN